MGIRLGNITFDCDDVLKVARFWSGAIDRPLDDGAGEFYASIGGGDSQRSEPAWYFEKVPEQKVAKNRMHLDFVDPHPDVVDRLVGLGASVVAEHELDWAHHSWTVMQDPEGNEFCIAAKSFGG